MKTKLPLIFVVIIIWLTTFFQGNAQTQSICEGAVKTYTVNGPGSGPVGSTYNWSLVGSNAGNYAGTTNLSAQTANAITINWASTPAGTYTLQVIETNNSCEGDPVTLTIVITAPPVAGTISGTQEVCTGATTTFAVSGNSASGTWSSSDTNVAIVNASGEVTAVGAGTATISYTVVGTGGCTDAVATRTVTVTNPPIAGTISGTQEVCTGATTTFAVSGNSASGTWSSSDTNVASVNASGEVTAVGVGTATISYTVAGTGGCTDAVATRTVTVTNPPIAGTISGTQEVCTGATTTFAVSGNSASGTWSSSDTNVATVNASGEVTAVGAGTATISYIVAGTGGCTDAVAIRTVTVTNPPIAGTISGTQEVCTSNTTTFTIFGNSATGIWSSSDTNVATVSTSGVVTAVAPGSATITYTVAGSGGCLDATTTRVVNVNSVPVTSPIQFD